MEKCIRNNQNLHFIDKCIQSGAKKGIQSGAQTPYKKTENEITACMITPAGKIKTSPITINQGQL